MGSAVGQPGLRPVPPLTAVWPWVVTLWASAPIYRRGDTRSLMRQKDAGQVPSPAPLGQQLVLSVPRADAQPPSPTPVGAPKLPVIIPSLVSPCSCFAFAGGHCPGASGHPGLVRKELNQRSQKNSTTGRAPEKSQETSEAAWPHSPRSLWPLCLSAKRASPLPLQQRLLSWGMVRGGGSPRCE